MWINEINTFDAMAKRCTEIERYQKGQRAKGKGSGRRLAVGQNPARQAISRAQCSKWPGDEAAAACLGV